MYKNVSTACCHGLFSYRFEAEVIADVCLLLAKLSFSTVLMCACVCFHAGSIYTTCRDL